MTHLLIAHYMSIIFSRTGWYWQR